MSVLEKLRVATGPLHADLEQRLDLPARLLHADQRSLVVRRFFGLHSGAEDTLAEWLGDLPGLDFEARRRSSRLATDLMVLGFDPARAARAPAPQLANPSEALGFFYVLEGSSLGGKAIEKSLTAAGADMTGLSFLNPYGPATGERWRAFLAVLEREGLPPTQGAIVRGGLLGFAAARDWLCDSALAAA